MTKHHAFLQPGRSSLCHERWCYRLILLTGIVFGCRPGGHAQKLTRTLILDVPEAPAGRCFYDSVAVLDSREDTGNLGVIQRGAFNRKAFLIPAEPLDVQLNRIPDAFVDTAKQEGTLLVHLRRFRFAELDKGMMEYGYCSLRAGLYARQGSGYRRVGFLDTVLVIQSSWDVTKPMLRAGGEALTHLVLEGLTELPSDTTTYSLLDLMHIDSLEKSRIPLYCADAYVDGVYDRYASFAKQIPDHQADVVLGNDRTISSVRMKTENGKKRKVRSKALYAIVYKNHPYIATPFGYYPLEKKGSDFFFRGKAYVSPSTLTMAVATAFFGIPGELAASSASAVFEQKLDHLNGGFIQIRRIETAEK